MLENVLRVIGCTNRDRVFIKTERQVCVMSRLIQMSMMRGISLKERKKSTELIELLGLMIKKGTVRSFGHVECKEC